MQIALQVDGISKRYANHLAVDRLDLSIPSGTIYGILGPNGAGKSTTLRMVMNIIGRDSGTVSLLGIDPAADRRVLRRVGYLPEERGLYKKMKVTDVIVFFARLKGMDERSARREAGIWLERMGLGEWREGRVETLSKGMQQKVQFITTVIHQPELLILDEPQSGLDPVNQEVLRETILSARDEGRTVIFSTHNMDQAEQMCESVCIITQGRKVLDGRVRELRRENRGERYSIEFDSVSEAITRLMRPGPLFRDVVLAGDGWRIELAPGVDLRSLMGTLTEQDEPLIRFERVHPSLHEIFVQHAGDAGTSHRRPEPAHV
jgi:ABC-2 type transport system ATP-binding protein